MKKYKYSVFLKLPYNITSLLVILYFTFSFILIPIYLFYDSENFFDMLIDVMISYFYLIISTLIIIFILYMSNYPDIIVKEEKVVISFMYFPIEIKMEEIKKIEIRKSLNYFKYGLFLKNRYCKVYTKNPLKRFVFTDRICGFDDLIKYFMSKSVNIEKKAKKTILYFN